MTPLKFFTRHWHDVGLVSAVVAGIYLVVSWDEIGMLQRILTINFIIVLLHQFEEYSWPGGFPSVANVVLLPQFGGAFKPLNQLSSAAANCAFAYGFYLLPILFPNTIWLGLATFIVGAVIQVIGHAIVVNYRIRSPYSPGVATAVLGWLPLGVIYVNYICQQRLVSGWDWLIAVGYMGMAMYICFYAIEQTWLGSDDPKYPFDQDELDRFGIPQKFEAARRHRERRKPA